MVRHSIISIIIKFNKIENTDVQVDHLKTNNIWNTSIIYMKNSEQNHKVNKLPMLGFVVDTSKNKDNLEFSIKIIVLAFKIYNIRQIFQVNSEGKY